MKLFRRKSKLEKFYIRNKEFINYNIVSFVCTLVLYLVFFIVDLITKGNYIVANFLSYSISFSLLYVLDMKVFKAKPFTRRGKIRQLTSFIIVRLIGFPLDSLVLSFLINHFNIGNMAAKVIASLIMFIYNYLTNKLFVFKKNRLLWYFIVSFFILKKI